VSLHKQAISMSVLHAASVLQPLVVLPYAAWILGPHGFGQYALAMSIGGLAATIVAFGFHLTAQRDAASVREDPPAIALLFADVFAVKAALCILILLLGLAAAGVILPISKLMFWCIMLSAIGEVLFPLWLFIGLERAWIPALAVGISRSLALAGFLTLVRSPAQLELAVALQSAIPLVAGLITLPFIVPLARGGFRSMTISRIKHRFNAGRRGFSYSLVETASTTVPVLLVGHFGGYSAAGQYAVAERVMAATYPLVRVMIDTLLPRVSYYAQHAPQLGIVLIRKSFSTLIIGATVACFLFFGAPYIVSIFFGEQFSGAVPILRVMAIIPFLVNINIITSYLFMFTYGYERAWARLSIFAFLAFLIVAGALVYGAADATLAVAVALITKEAVVLLVSGAFFVGYSHRARASEAHSVGTARHPNSRPPSPLAIAAPSTISCSAPRAGT
jgi:O-antigen/teichoic acid export membrane protein